MVDCSVAGEKLVLLPERAVFWPARRLVFVADFHLGKAATFRSAGIPLPSGTTTENVERLGRAIDKTGATSVVFLGDFLHAKQGRAASTFNRFGAWREARKAVDVVMVRGNHDKTGATSVVFLGDFLHAKQGRAASTFNRFGAWREARKAVDVVMVRGNHDKKAGDPPEAWRMRCIEAGERIGPFVLNHEPGPARGGGYALAGHIHPAVRLSGCGDESLRLPCFWFGARYGVLPAFGAFTGTAEVRPRRGDQVFVIAEEEVIEVS